LGEKKGRGRGISLFLFRAHSREEKTTGPWGREKGAVKGKSGLRGKEEEHTAIYGYVAAEGLNRRLAGGGRIKALEERAAILIRGPRRRSMKRGFHAE